MGLRFRFHNLMGHKGLNTKLRAFPKEVKFKTTKYGTQRAAISVEG